MCKSSQYQIPKEVVEAVVEEMTAMLPELFVNIGRAIVHGDGNGDSPIEIATNIESDIKMCLINRWASCYHPEIRGMEPKNSNFPDDKDWEDTYADYGFNRD